MQERLRVQTIVPEAYKALFGAEAYIHNSSGLESSLLNLIKLRASQINGCAECIDMHTKDARASGETEQRLYELSAWRETPFYTARERAALAWTEAVTLVSETHVPDEVYEEAKREFTDAELVNLTLAIALINCWNRFNIAFPKVPGDCQPQHLKKTA